MTHCGFGEAMVFLLSLMVLSTETLRLCTMLRGLAFDNDNSGSSYLYYLNQLILQHANKIGAKYNQNFTMSTFADSGASGNAIINTNTAYSMLNLCDFVVGPYSSGQVKNAMPIFTLNRIPACSGSASNQALENKIEYPYFIRTCPNDGIQGMVLAEFIISNNWKKINLLNDGGAYAVGVLTAFSKNIAKYNLNPANEPIVTITNQTFQTYQTDFSLMLQEIKDNECTITLFLGEVSEFQSMISSAKDSQTSMFKEDYVWIGADTFGDYKGSVNILYSTFAADTKTQPYEDLNTLFASIARNNNTVATLDDLTYGPFYPSCIDVYLSYIDAAKKKHNVTYFKDLGPNWFLNNTDLLSNMNVNGPTGNISVNYSNDLVSDYNIMQYLGDQNQPSKAFLFSASTGKISSQSGFNYPWLVGNKISDTVNIDSLATTVSGKYPFFYYLMIIVGSLLIVVAVASNLLSILKSKGWTIKKALATVVIIFGNVSSITFILDLNPSVCAFQRFFGIVAINVCGVLITMKLWKLFKTLSGIRIEIKGKTDENLVYLPLILVFTNAVFSFVWVIASKYQKEHVYTAEGTDSYEFYCSTSSVDQGFFIFLVIFNALIYLYALFLAYIVRSNKIVTKLSRYMNYILLNSLFFILLSVCFTSSAVFNLTTNRIVLSIFLFMGSNILFLLLRQDNDKASRVLAPKPKSADGKKSGNKFGSTHDLIDRGTLGSLVKLNTVQANDNNIFFDYVEVLNVKLKINVWRRFFLLFNGNDKYISLHTIKKISSNNEYQLKSDGIVYKLEFCTKPALIEDLDRKNKIKILLDNNIEMTIVFSNEEMVRKFKSLMNLSMANIRAKFTKNVLGHGLGGQMSNSLSSLRSSEDVRKKMLKVNSLDDIKRPSPSKSIEDLKRSRNL